jgi:hypothetical protein
MLPLQCHKVGCTRLVSPCLIVNVHLHALSIRATMKTLGMMKQVVNKTRKAMISTCHILLL